MQRRSTTTLSKKGEWKHASAEKILPFLEGLRGSSSRTGLLATVADVFDLQNSYKIRDHIPPDIPDVLTLISPAPGRTCPESDFRALPILGRPLGHGVSLTYL